MNLGGFHWILQGLIFLVAIDSVVELCLISSTLSWIFGLKGYTFYIGTDDQDLWMAALPTELATLSDYGDLAFSGLTFVIIACGGVTLCRVIRFNCGRIKPATLGLTAAWTFFCLLAGLLGTTLFAWAIYCERKGGNVLEISVVERLRGKPYPGRWYFAGWIGALQLLQNMGEEQRRSLRLMELVIRSRKWNCLVLGFLCCTLVALSLILQQRLSRDEWALTCGKNDHDSNARPEENNGSSVQRSPNTIHGFFPAEEPCAYSNIRSEREPSSPPASPSSQTPLLERHSF